MATETITGHASTTLTQLLDDELAFSPSFQGIYSNHLAMALVALDQLGAPPDVLRATFDAHANGEYERRDDRDELEVRRQEVARDGIAATVRVRAAGLVDGPGTALFHPAIRLGYALDVGHQSQVAAALLDWERRHQALPVSEPSPGSRRLVEVAADLAGRPPGSGAAPSTSAASPGDPNSGPRSPASRSTSTPSMTCHCLPSRPTSPPTTSSPCTLSRCSGREDGGGLARR